MTVAEKKESFWKRHLVALIVGGFAVFLLVIVVGHITSAALAAVFFVDRHRRKGGKGGKPTDAGAQPATPSSIAESSAMGR